MNSAVQSKMKKPTSSSILFYSYFPEDEPTAFQIEFLTIC